LPLGRRLRSLPAQVTGGRSRVRQAEKRLHLAVIDGFSFDFACFCFDGERVGMSERRHPQQRYRGQGTQSLKTKTHRKILRRYVIRTCRRGREFQEPSPYREFALET